MKTINIFPVNEWGSFKISKLFEIKSPAKRTTKSYSEGNVPYVSSGSFNNGVVSYLEPKYGETLEKAGCITVSPLDGSSFYQEEDFLGRGGAGSAISLLYNDEINLYSALFICTVIKSSASKFNYADALTSKNLSTFQILLPVKKNDDGTVYYDAKKKYSDEGLIPDWNIMESYMREIEIIAKKKIEILRR